MTYGTVKLRYREKYSDRQPYQCNLAVNNENLYMDYEDNRIHFIVLIYY